MIIQVNDTSYHVEIQGEGEPLLLLHGFTGSHHNWSAFMPRWSDHFKVIAVDLLGHGQTESPADPGRYTMDHAVQDLIAIMDALHIHKANVLGYSMGGRVALSLAVLAPERVSKLILESSSPGLQTAEERRARVKSDESLADRIVHEGMNRFVSYWENIPLFQSIKLMPQDVQLSIREQRLRNNPLGLANSLRGMGTGAQPSWWERLREIAMPVLLITGERDEKFDRIAQQMMKAVPHSSYVKVPGAGHLVHVEQSQLFDTIVGRFLISTFNDEEGLV